MPGLPAITFLGLKGSAAWVAAGVATAAAVGVAAKVAPALFAGVGGSSSGGSSSASASPSQIPTIAQLLDAVTKGGAIAADAAQAGLGAGAQLRGAGIRLAGDVTSVLGEVTRTQTGAIVATNASLARIVEKATPAAQPAPVTGPSVGVSAPAPAPIAVFRPPTPSGDILAYLARSVVPAPAPSYTPPPVIYQPPRVATLAPEPAPAPVAAAVAPYSQSPDAADRNASYAAAYAAPVATAQGGGLTGLS